jgi:uncharacterized protein
VTTPLVLGWAQVEALVERLAGVLEREAAPDRLIVVARGGLVPGGLLAGRLDVPCVEAVQVQGYDGKTRRPLPAVVGAVPGRAGPSGDPARTLLFDELVESGATLRLLSAHLPLARRAVLLVKATLGGGAGGVPGYVHLPGPSGAVDGFGFLAADVVAPERWVTFPWSPASERG